MKLKVHNFTFYNLANHKVMNCWWNETEGELEASIFCSIVINYLTSYFTGDKYENLIQMPKKIILYSDGCGYQNRNVLMSNALLNFSIHIKYYWNKSF